MLCRICACDNLTAGTLPVTAENAELLAQRHTHGATSSVWASRRRARPTRRGAAGARPPIDKRNQTSDWTRQPLTSEQETYAAMDVETLVDLYESFTVTNGS
ncbi:MAG: hypothetical protein HY791_10060 [Deltaproteobacteria bacterium]|nr:hypothetical protein [Deltaproteobacteria bacterium]